MHTNDVVFLGKGHYFHKDCELGKTIGQYIEEKKKCPVCAYFYGVALGDMPPGRMTVSLSFFPSLPLSLCLSVSLCLCCPITLIHTYTPAS